MATMPFYGTNSMARNMARAFQDPGFDSTPFMSAFLPGRFARGYPLVNLYDDDDRHYVEALAPGLDPSKLNLTVVHNTLTISGEKMAPPADIKPDAFHRQERSAGKFVRAISLPVEIDDKGITAEYANGLLLITLPKAKHAKPQQVSVQVS